LKQSSTFIPQFSSMNPGGQMQVKSSSLSTQDPPFSQGLGEQLSTVGLQSVQLHKNSLARIT